VFTVMNLQFSYKQEFYWLPC